MPSAEETIWLQGRRNSRTAHSVPCLHELSAEDKSRTNLVSLGKRCENIPGDPFGVLLSWAGNVAHPQDDRIFEVMEPIFEALNKMKSFETDLLQSARRFLAKVPKTEPEALAQETANEGTYSLIKKSPEETTVEFQLGTQKVCLIQAHDIDKDLPSTYGGATRAKEAKHRARAAFDEPRMPVAVQQYLMACLLRDDRTESRQNPDNKNMDEKFYKDLRSTAQMNFWLLMTRQERDRCRTESTKSQPMLEDFVSIIKSNWQSSWNATDYFWNYAKDQAAAENDAWQMVDADILVVTDKNKRVVFANIEQLTQMMFGDDAAPLLERCLDLWSFFTPLPLPETSRHVVDRYIRLIHPELDMKSATAERLACAKMAVAHWGCWPDKYDNLGLRVFRSRDAAFTRSERQEFSRSLFPQLCQSALGKVTALIRFLMQPLDVEYYDQCIRVLQNLPVDEKLKTDEEDFLSLFAFGVNGYTQRHKDSRDNVGGLAGLVTLGHYTGGHLCVPQLGLRVRYTPGSCALIRGDKLEHLVQDFTPPRFFVIGTNHERTRKYAFRKMGLLPQLSSRKLHSEQDPKPSEDCANDSPCVNPGCDEDDEDYGVEWTNEQIHGPAVLSSKSSTDSQHS